MIQPTIFKKFGTCANCKEKNCELEKVEMNGKQKEWCDACREGWKMEEELKKFSKQILR